MRVDERVARRSRRRRRSRTARPRCSSRSNDLADRPPRSLGDGEVHRPRRQAGPLRSTRRTSRTAGRPACCSRRRRRRSSVGDLFTAMGECPAITDADIVGPALAAEEMFHATALTPATAPTIRRLADLDADDARADARPRVHRRHGARRCSAWPRRTSRSSPTRCRPAPEPNGPFRSAASGRVEPGLMVGGFTLRASGYNGGCDESGPAVRRRRAPRRPGGPRRARRSPPRRRARRTRRSRSTGTSRRRPT